MRTGRCLISSFIAVRALPANKIHLRTFHANQTTYDHVALYIGRYQLKLYANGRRIDPNDVDVLGARKFRIDLKLLPTAAGVLGWFIFE